MTPDDTYRLNRLEKDMSDLELHVNSQYEKLSSKLDTVILLLLGALVTVTVFALGTAITLLTSRGFS
jgi:hypothetical protein